MNLQVQIYHISVEIGGVYYFPFDRSGCCLEESFSFLQTMSQTQIRMGAHELSVEHHELGLRLAQTHLHLWFNDSNSDPNWLITCKV